MSTDKRCEPVIEPTPRNATLLRRTCHGKTIKRTASGGSGFVSAGNSGVRVAQKLNISYELVTDWLLRFKFGHTDRTEEKSKYFFNEEKLRLMNLYFATMPGRRKFAVKYNIPDTLF